MTVVSTTSKKKRRKLKIFGGLYIGGIAAACVLLIYYWEIISRFQSYGYFGLFFIGLVTGFTLPMPVPYMVLTFVLGGILHPALVGASCGLGLGIGGTLLHLTGRGGRKFFPMSSVFGVANARSSSSEEPPPFISRLFRRARIPQIMALAQRRGALVVFLMSVAINPFFAPMAIALGTMRFRLWKFFLMCWAGQTVKCVAIAYAGYLGLGTILRWLEAI
ncbi:hypothetical protein ES703_60850 [subsurface metagenome]